MRDDIVSRREVMASLVAEYNRRYSEGGLKLAWIEKAVNDTPALQPSGGRLIDADRLKWHYSWWNNEEQRTFDQIVDAQPTADAVPVKHGKWIDAIEHSGTGGTVFVGHRCSVCDYWKSMGIMHYCPNCGATMDGGADNG